MVLQVEGQVEEQAISRREMYTMKEFSRLTGLGLTAIRRGIRENDLPVQAIKVGGQWMFARRPVDRLVGLESD